VDALYTHAKVEVKLECCLPTPQRVCSGASACSSGRSLTHGRPLDTDCLRAASTGATTCCTSPSAASRAAGASGTMCARRTAAPLHYKHLLQGRGLLPSSFLAICGPPVCREREPGRGGDLAVTLQCAAEAGRRCARACRASAGVLQNGLDPLHLRVLHGCGARPPGPGPPRLCLSRGLRPRWVLAGLRIARASPQQTPANAAATAGAQ